MNEQDKNIIAYCGLREKHLNNLKKIKKVGSRSPLY